ncbi:UDP-N-acetylglucosamine 2-epimerase (non-hydrolyzing) [Kineococcus endophyticus]|uniref:UDP-N-acetylglucosamine 2-epimerase (non-hydrolyzing) n=1 Tax=Kineococcus endophyticus TaxID=1181883 RepID=A0ABV3P831_9ACTN
MAVVGTRPEAIKMAPLIARLRASGTAVRVLSTGQHTTVVSDVLTSFGLSPEVTLGPWPDGRTLGRLLADVEAGTTEHLNQADVAAVVVQGDTTSALAAALAAFNARVPVVHLEAGLRTADLHNPFPEEGNRRLIGQIADLHLAPTERARAALVREGVAAERIAVTGNTVIDALLTTVAGLAPATEDAGSMIDGGRRGHVLVTAHRRESWGAAFQGILDAVRHLATTHRRQRFLWAAHPNPELKGRVLAAMDGLDNVQVVPPLPYRDMVAALRDASVVLTDSGGLQEEAPSLGKPVLVMRASTERPEAVDAGCARLIGTGREAIVGAVRELLLEDDDYRRMSAVANPYGDGRAAEYAAREILEHFPAAAGRPSVGVTVGAS